MSGVFTCQSALSRAQRRFVVHKYFESIHSYYKVPLYRHFIRLINEHAQLLLRHQTLLLKAIYRSDSCSEYDFQTELSNSRYI